jgi:hypothetical protein
MTYSFELFKDIPTNYRDFKGASADELGYGENAVTSAFYEHIAENGQRLGIYTTQPNGTGDTLGRTIIVPASHDYRIEPAWMTRADIIASSAQSRVILVDMPGTTGLLKADGSGGWDTYNSLEPVSGSAQTGAQLRKALVGDYSEHARVQLESIIQTVGIDLEDEIILLGESMGAPVATEMLALSEKLGLKVNELILYEAVNTHKGYRLDLPFRMMSILGGVEKNRRAHYIQENIEIGHPSTAFEMNEQFPFQAELDRARKSLGQQAIAAGINGVGLAMGMNTRLKNTLKTIAPSDRPDVTLVRGRESLATTRDGYESLYAVLSSLGMEPRVHEVTDAATNKYPIGHAHVFSLARQRQIADTLFKR